MYNEELFCARLRDLAKSQFGGTSGLARAIGMSRTQISNYINGASKPGFNLLQKLAEADVDLNWLLGVDKVSELKRGDHYNKIQQTKVVVESLPNYHAVGLYEELADIKERIEKLLQDRPAT